MKAVVCSGYGPPDRLQVRRIDQPRPAAGEVLVGVRATTVNRTDSAALRGKPWFARAVTGLTRPKHQVLGTEFAGHIEAIGADVTEFSVGDDVFGFNEATSGAHAQYLVMAASGPLTTIPPGTDLAEVGAGRDRCQRP